MTFFVYVLRCSDGSFYTGIARDVERRMKQHASGSGSRYVRTRRPFSLAYREEAGDRSQALKREIQIKRMARWEKARLVNGQALRNGDASR